MHFMSYNFLYDPLSPFQFRLIFIKRIAYRYSFKSNTDRMRHTTFFDTRHPLIYHMYSLKANIMHLMSNNFLYDPLSSFQFRLNFKSVLLSDIGSNETQIEWDARLSSIHPSLLYTTCIALKPVLCILCHVTFYTIASASFNLYCW